MINDSNRKFFDIHHEQLFTYLSADDTLLKPAHGKLLPSQTSLKTRISSRYTVEVPIIAAAMDTITSAEMAIAMAKAGGAAVIHRNASPEQQVEMAKRVLYELRDSIEKPRTALASTTVGEHVQRLAQRKQQKKKEFHTFPIVDETGVVLGLVTGKDVAMAKSDPKQTLGSIMTKVSDLVTVGADTVAREAYEIMRQHKKSVLLSLDNTQRISKMFLFSTLQSTFEEDHSGYSILPETGQLLVAAAIGVGESHFERLEMLLDAGVRLFVIDNAHADHEYTGAMLDHCKKQSSEADFIAGNIATEEGAKYLLDHGADAIKVGIGPGSICTTRTVTGFGVPQLSAVYMAARIAEPYKVPVIADGGCKVTADIAKMLVAGADIAMVGSMLSGTDECPGERFHRNGKEWKLYRGMGSPNAIRDRPESMSDRYLQHGVPVSNIAPQGVESRVPYRGPVGPLLAQYANGLQSALGYAGAQNIHEFQKRTLFIRQTQNGVRESGVHDVEAIDGIFA